jgi:hypothetical protein
VLDHDDLDHDDVDHHDKLDHDLELDLVDIDAIPCPRLLPSGSDL